MSVIRSVVIGVAALSLIAVAPAQADPEPDNWIWQARGPATSGSITGTLASNNDVDYYMFYAASQTQLSVTSLPIGCGSSLGFGLYDTNGDYLTHRSASTTKNVSMNYTTPSGTNRFFVRVYRISSLSSCVGQTYRVNVGPTSALLAGPSMNSGSTPTGEPNETAEQAAGPLAADTIYSGVSETQNDQDWFYFYASGAFQVEATENAGCSSDFHLYDQDMDYLGATYAGENRYRQFTYTPDSWRRFYIKVDGDCVGAGYRFSLGPASAIQSGPAPVPVVPGGVGALATRKTKKTVVVYWAAATGAQGYQVRKAKKRKKYGPWSGTANTWTSIKKKKIPKKRGMWIKVRAVNSVGHGTPSVRKIRR